MEEFKGILFTLKKRVENIGENDNNYYKYLVMGYYDGLDIHVVDNWYEMRPRGLRERNLQVDISLPFVDQYTMRAFFPENRQKLEAKGFSYNIWEKIGEISADAFRKNIAEDREENQYICMSIINIADPSLLGDNLSRIPEKLENRLSEAAAYAGVSLSEQHCAIFPSIGYADYLILFLTDDLSQVSRILSGLRRETDKEILISGIYSVCGIDSASIGGMKECPDVQLALYINLREGISVGNFIQGLNEERIKAEDESYIEELDHLRAEVEENVYLTFGYSDSMIVLYRPLSTYKQLYAENHILNPGHDFFRKYIGNLKTSVRMKERLSKPEIGPINPPRGSNELEKKYKTFVEKYSEFLENNNFPIRSAIGLKQIMKNFLNIASLSRSFDISVVLGDAFMALMNAVTFYISKPKALPTKIGQVAKKLEEQEKYKEKIKNEYRETVEAVKLYKESIGNFIADLMRSDCAFIEGNTLSHPAIGSATKLLFSYTEILKSLTQKYNEADKLQFIVISGGCDQTEAEDLFSFASPEENEKIKKLIIISIPEMSLYDVRGTLFRILHESMHFIGDRLRKERYRFIIEALSEYIAYDIAEMQFPEDLLHRYIKCASVRCNAELKQKICLSYEECYRKNKKCAEREIATVIKNCKPYVSYTDHREDAYYHKGEILKNVLNSNQFAKGLGDAAEEDLRKPICKILCNRYEEILKSFNDILRDSYKAEKENGGNTAYRLHQSCQLFDLLLKQYQYKKSAKEYDKATMNFVDKYFETFLYYVEHQNLHMDIHYPELVDDIISAMVESYSDCSAISLTGMRVEDFLLSFIYEVWDIDYAFPLVLRNYLRIGADLKVMYGIEGKLGDEIENRIKKKVENMAAHGYIYKYTDDMIKRIDYILKKYQEEQFQGICESLEKYINEFLSLKQDAMYPGLKEMYKHCAFRDEGEDDSVYKSINVMLNQWRKIGGISNES